MSVKYKRKDWVVMTEDTNTTYDDLCLPVFEKVTLVIVRRVTEPERRKCKSVKRWNAAKEGKQP